MKKEDIIFLLQNGFMNTTTLSLESKSAYQIFKFKKLIKSIGEAIDNDTKELIESVFGENYQKDLSLLSDMKKKMQEDSLPVDKLERFNELLALENKVLEQRKEMLNESVTFSEIIPISYEEWRNFQKENNEDKLLSRILSYIEILTENILWKMSNDLES